jgi:hypothetical protein
MTLAEHCEQYVMTAVIDGNPDLAREYAAFIVSEDAVGNYGPLGPGDHDHARDFPAWARENTRPCGQCGAMYAHRMAGTEAFMCGCCGCSMTRP